MNAKPARSHVNPNILKRRAPRLFCVVQAGTVGNALTSHLPTVRTGRRRMHLPGNPAMQGVIGNNLVKQLRPAAKPFEIRDTRVKGFLLRVQPSGTMTYYAEYGRGKRISLGRSEVLAPDKARQRAKEILAGAQLG